MAGPCCYRQARAGRTWALRERECGEQRCGSRSRREHRGHTSCANAISRAEPPSRSITEPERVRIRPIRFLPIVSAWQKISSVDRIPSLFRCNRPGRGSKRVGFHRLTRAHKRLCGGRLRKETHSHRLAACARLRVPRPAALEARCSPGFAQGAAPNSSRPTGASHASLKRGGAPQPLRPAQDVISARWKRCYERQVEP